MLSIQNDYEKSIKIIHAVAKERIEQGRNPGVTWTLENTTPERLLERFPDKSEYFTVQLDDRAVGAFILTKKKTNPKWNIGIGFRYLAKFCILNEYRRMGHADRVLGMIRAGETSGTRLEVRKKGQEGLERLYLRNGFIQKGSTGDMLLLERRNPINRIGVSDGQQDNRHRS